MCGRYALHSRPEVVALQFGLDSVPRFAPRFNIAPAASALVIGPQGPTLARWGLRGSRHNARADSAAVRRMARCLVPANGFFEWKRSGSLSQPYFVFPTKEPLFAFAALWEDASFAVVTTEANEDTSAIHHRMPVILAPRDYARWLDGEDGLLRPCPAGTVRCHPVGTEVNRAASDSAALIAPLASAIQPGLFD